MNIDISVRMYNTYTARAVNIHRKLDHAESFMRFEQGASNQKRSKN